MEKRIIWLIFSLILYIAGAVLIINEVGWQVFWGIFLMMWANNITNTYG
jgi:hypothetical protein